MVWLHLSDSRAGPMWLICVCGSEDGGVVLLLLVLLLLLVVVVVPLCRCCRPFIIIMAWSHFQSKTRVCVCVCVEVFCAVC